MWFFGCTHYPLAKKEIQEILGENVTFFNGAPNLANHLKEVLEKKVLLEESEGKIEFIDSQNAREKKERFFKIIEEK